MSQLPITLTGLTAQFDLTNLNPDPGTFYQNYQGTSLPTGTPTIQIPTGGQYIATYMDVPHSGDRRIIVLSDFTVSVQNNQSSTIDVYAQIGVSNPAAGNYPMTPYVGVLHSIGRAQIPVGAMAMLTATRMDVIDPSLLAVTLPWTMSLGGNGTSYPQLAPSVFGPVGVLLCNCAARVWVVG